MNYNYKINFQYSFLAITSLYVCACRRFGDNGVECSGNGQCVCAQCVCNRRVRLQVECTFWHSLDCYNYACIPSLIYSFPHFAYVSYNIACSNFVQN